MLSRRSLLATIGATPLVACASNLTLDNGSDASVVEIMAPGMSDVIDPNSRFDVLGTGYQWSEGPAWDRARGILYFTDVPQNTAYQWSEGQGVQLFMDPSGASRTEGFREPGANGLWYSSDGSLLICNHGHRAIECMNLDSREVSVLAQDFAGKRFNSPNDIVQARDGTLFFTDPPYGLAGLDASPLKQQDANGVYRLDPDGTVTRLISDMTFPNGIALSPDEQTLYVSQSDPDAPVVRALGLDSSHGITSDRILFDAAPFMSDLMPGLPDGMAVSANGALFVTGPGGVFVLASDGQPLGRILTGRATANCTFGEAGRSLFITAGDRLLRIRTKVQGVQWS